MMIIKRLKSTREILGLKQCDVAKTLNVSFTTYANYELGNDTIPLEKLIQYSNIFNYSLDYLFGLTDINVVYEPIKEINLKELGLNLKLLRKKNNHTQQYIASKLNYATSTYCHYELGRSLIKTTFLFALKDIYPNFSIDALFKRVVKS